MCPPAPIAPVVELNDYPTSEVVCKFLMQLKSGCSLPLNVLTDVDPYQHKPSNLPEGIWYFWSGTKEDTENGFWSSTGEACEIHLTSTIIGLRRTLQYYEGQAPHGQRTNWMMQEYTITDKYGSKLDTRGLYRVFSVDDSSSGHPPKSELLEKNVDDGAGAPAMANQSPDPPSAIADQPKAPRSPMANRSLDPFLEDCVSRGDYLGWNDLAIPLSLTTSSVDSSGRTFSSEELFDSDALMRELEDDPVDYKKESSLNKVDNTTAVSSEELFDSEALMRELGDGSVDQEIRDSRVNLNLSAPAKPKEVVMHPTTIVPTGSLNGGLESKPCKGQTSNSNPTPQNEAGNHKKVNTSNRTESTPASSSSSEGSSKEEKRRAKKRKMMKYLCFLAF